jgi:hypothetical protein
MPSNHNKYRNVDLLGASSYRQPAPRGSLDLLSEACEEAAAELGAPREPLLHDEPEEMDEEDIKQEDSPPILPQHLLSEREAGTEFKLPALKLGRPPRSEPLDPIGRLQHRSSTTRTSSIESLPSSRPSTAHTTPGAESRSHTPDIYPSLGQITNADDDHLVGRVDKMDLDARPRSSRDRSGMLGQGLKHAQLIRDILVAVNADWKRRHRAASRSLLEIDIKEEEDIKPTLAELKEQETPSTPTRRSTALIGEH